MKPIFETLLKKLEPQASAAEPQADLPFVIAAQVIGAILCLISIPIQLTSGHQGLAITLLFDLLVLSVSHLILRYGHGRAAKFVMHCGVTLILMFQYILAPPGYGVEFLFPVAIILALFFYSEKHPLEQRIAQWGSGAVMMLGILLKIVIDGPGNGFHSSDVVQRLTIGFATLLVIYVVVSRYSKQTTESNQKLRQAMIEFQAIGKAVEDCFFIFDFKNPGYSFMSYAYADVFGRSPIAGLAGWQDYVSFVDPKDADKVREAFLGGHVSQRLEIIYGYMAGPGDVRTIRTTVSYLGPPDHESPVLIGVHRNITAEVQAKAQEEARRVQSLEASRLSLVGEMAGGVAHEINNPLAVIDGNVDLLRQRLRVREPSVERSLEKINLMVVRIAKIVRGLLIFSGQTEESYREHCTIQKVIEGALDFYAQKAGSAGIKMAVCVPPETPLVAVNPPQISQVILHLLTNSFDAVAKLDDKWIRIEVKAEGQWVLVIVTDSGHGIPEKVADKIMQPFFTTKEIGKGTGLGLSVSRGIMMSHGGSLELDRTSPNTRFVMSLPLVREADAAA
jgi:signal transduction histidine kinase